MPVFVILFGRAGDVQMQPRGSEIVVTGHGLSNSYDQVMAVASLGPIWDHTLGTTSNDAPTATRQQRL
jgi:hypothetical protein